MHKRIWNQILGGAMAAFALMTSLCPNGFDTLKTQQHNRLGKVSKKKKLLGSARVDFPIKKKEVLKTLEIA